MDRYKTIIIKVDPEVEDLKILNSKIQENRDKQAAKQMRLQRSMQQVADQARADERRLRRLEKEYQLQTNKLADRILLCLLLCFGVYLFWCAGVMSVGLFVGVCFICSCVVAYHLGVTYEKHCQLGGEMGCH